MSNGFSSADMSTAAANGHAEGYQAGYADAVKAVEAGGSPDADARSQIRNAFFKGVARTCDEVAPGIILSVAAQEVVPYGYVFTDDPTKFAMPGPGFHFGPVPPTDAINVIPLYAAPVAAAPALSPGAAFARQLIDEGAENYIGEVFDTERGDIEVTARYVTGKTPADRLAELEARTPAAPGIDLGELAELLRIWLCNFDSGVRPDDDSEPEEAALWDRIERIRQQAIGASPKGDAPQDDRFPGGFADAIAYADEMEEGAGRLYEQVIGFEDGSHTGTDMLSAVLRQLQDSPKGGSDERTRFEAWAAERGWSLSPARTNCDVAANGMYKHPAVQRCWEAWEAAALRAAPEVGDSYIVLQRVDVNRLLAGDENSPGYELSRRRIAACLDLHNQHGIAVVADSSQVVPAPALGAHEVHPEAVDVGLDLGESGEGLLAADALEHAASVGAECDGSATAPEWQPIETAPKDDTPVDLWRPVCSGERLANMRRIELSPGNVFYTAIESGYTCVRDATHWMPLPSPPLAARPQGVKDA